MWQNVRWHREETERKREKEKKRERERERKRDKKNEKRELTCIDQQTFVYVCDSVGLRLCVRQKPFY